MGKVQDDLWQTKFILYLFPTPYLYWNSANAPKWIARSGVSYLHIYLILVIDEMYISALQSSYLSDGKNAFKFQGQSS